MLNSYLYSIGNYSPHAYLTDRRGNYGPNELAEVVLHFTQAMDSLANFSNWTTEDGLRKLIEVAFFASLEPEEGRFPRCTLFLSTGPHRWFDVGSFDTTAPLTVAKLRKLAPISQMNDTAIRVELRDKSLFAKGITALKFEGLDSFLGRPGFVPTSRELNVQVHILGPGHVRVDLGSIEFELSAGQIRQCSNLSSLSVVRKLATEFGMSVGEEVITKLGLGEEECKLFGGLQTCIRDEKIIELFLRPILDAGHGGCVLVVPSFTDTDATVTESLQLPIRVNDLSLRVCYVDHLTECVEFHYPKTDVNCDVTSRVRRWLGTRGKLSACAKAIGELAAVDGCVVMDRSLSVIGFGGKINVSRDQALSSSIKFRNAKTNEEVSFSKLEELGGMRFQSALRFCKYLPNVIAFVVSQDQEMKVLWSEGNDAFAFGPITIPTVPTFG